MHGWQVVKKSFRDFYHHMFLLGGVSIIWFFTVAPLMYVGLGGVALKAPLPVLTNLLLVGPLTIGAFYLTNALINFKDVTVKTFFQAMRKLFVRGMLGYWFSLAVYVILFVDLYFFMAFGNKILMYLSGIWIYLLIFFAMSQFYFWSLLVETEDKIMKCAKKSMLMVVDNLLYSAIIFLVFTGLVVVGMVTAGVGLAVTFIGFMGILANNATYTLLVKYDQRKERINQYSAE